MTKLTNQDISDNWDVYLELVDAAEKRLYSDDPVVVSGAIEQLEYLRFGEFVSGVISSEVISG
jgi:hypothetical protein